MLALKLRLNLALFFSLVLPCLLPTMAHAEIETSILAPGAKIDVDGLIDEWRDFPSQQLKIVDKTSYKGDSDLSASVQSIYNNDYIYFAVTVKDEKFVRTTLAGNGEDRVELWFGNDAKGSSSTALSLYPADLNGSIGQDL